MFGQSKRCHGRQRLRLSIEKLCSRQLLAAEVLIFEDFQDQSVDGLGPVYSNSFSTGIVEVDEGEYVYESTFDRNETGTIFGSKFGAADSVELSFRLRMPDGIPRTSAEAHDFVGVKLSRLIAPQGTPSGHNMQNELLAFRNPDGSTYYQLLFYAEKNETADRVEINLDPSEWIDIRYRVTFNTPGLADGSMDVWVNGTQEVNRSGMVWADTATDRPESFWVGGPITMSGVDPATPMRRQLDDIRLVVGSPSAEDEMDPGLPISNMGDNGVFQVPGESGQSVSLRSLVTFRGAAYNNEMGVAYVDDKVGRVGNLLPSDSGWVQALMDRSQDFTVLSSGVEEGGDGQVELIAGRYFVFYLVQDNTVDQWRELNPMNNLGQSPQLYNSVESANSDRFDHVRESISADAIDLAWEDLEFGGDQNFTDLVVSNRFEPTAESYSEAVDDLFNLTARQIAESNPIELDVLGNDKLAGQTRIVSVDPPSSGSVSISESGTELLFDPEEGRFGPINFRYQIESGGTLSSASVELIIRKPWTNESLPADVNGDGEVTSLDLLSVINAWDKHPGISLESFPAGETRELPMVDANADGQLDVYDALYVFMHLLRKPSNPG